MSFWVSEAEQKKIKKLVAKTGLSQREYLLSAALGRTIYQVEELKPTLFELKAIGRNVNQLTMLAHQGRVMTVNLTEATNALERNYAAINGLYDALEGTVASGNIAQGDEDAYIYAYLDSSFMVMNVYVNPFGNNPDLKLTEDYVNQAADSFNYKNL